MTRSKSVYEHPEIVKLMYYNLKTAYVSNDKQKTAFYFAAIKKAVVPGNTNVVQEALSEFQMTDLRNMVDAIQRGIYYEDLSKPLAEAETKYVCSGDPSCWVQEEKQLQSFIAEDISSLNLILGTNFRVYNTEHPTEYGEVDILADEGRKICVIELKKGIADHKVVGQIQKYVRHFQKRLLWDLWDDDIKSVCIAGDFTEFAYTQLQKMGVTTVTYRKIGNGIEFRVV